ncbi:MAG: glycosyltransferase family 4 protein [Bacteroidales bacterium]
MAGGLKNIKILFVATHRPNRAPSQRFRFEQFIGFFIEKNLNCSYSYLVTSFDDKTFYSKGKRVFKFLLLIKYFFKRLLDFIRVFKYDLVFIQREAYFVGPALFERLFKISGVKIIYDFDDSIWINNVSDGNRNFIWMKSYKKISKIISISNMIFAGNKYLADYAIQYNSSIKIVPTTIDTDKYQRNPTVLNPDGKICIGWSGSITTIKHFEYAVNFLEKIKMKYGDKVIFKAIGDGSYVNESLNIKGIPWIEKDEINELSAIDIGIMPLPDDEWAKGKCGLKGLQYMALEIPTVMSPVGVNTEIIRDGVNGFLAKDENEWVEKLSLLIESAALRKKLGDNGRKTVEKHYSFEAWKDKYIEYFNEVLNYT